MNDSLLRPLDLRLLLGCRASLLLTLDHLLSSSFPRRLLLLTQSVLRLHLLTHALALRLLSRRAFSTLLFELLSAQIVELCSRTSITTTCLARQIRHLALSLLFGGDVGRVVYARLLRCRRSFISELERLISRPVGN